MLAVGDSTRLEVIFHTKYYYGPGSKSFRIETNVRPLPYYVTFKANIIRHLESTDPVVFEPYRLTFYPYSTPDNGSLRFEARNVSNENLELLLVDQPEGIFRVRLPRKIRAGKTAKGMVRLYPETREESFEKSITIEVSDTDQSRFTLPVKKGELEPGLSGDGEITSGAGDCLWTSPLSAAQE
ncbi:MAG: hypothetical protein JSU65_14755 [Candidatus Zixiibacteriota bacterium]|nr:MAG: hypothetical protein JSU65_14755 [candidate division Zixibacteria bacterium]